MPPREALLRQFYAHFERGEAAACIALLHPQARFTDHLIQARQGAELRALLGMLCHTRPGVPLDRRFAVSRVELTGPTTATVHWTADYTFAPTGRRLHNVITTPFEFEGPAPEARIVAYEDQFDLPLWHRQAFGPIGVLLGHTPLLTALVRRAIDGRLRRYRARHPEPASPA